MSSFIVNYIRTLDRTRHGIDDPHETVRQERAQRKLNRVLKRSLMVCTRCEALSPVRENHTRRYLRCQCGGVLVYTTAYKAAGLKAA